MRKIRKFLAIWILVPALCLLPAVGLAADFGLFWDPNCNEDPTLEGYSIYYKEDASVVAEPDGAIEIYLTLSGNGFDPSAPSYQITGLLNDMRYCFAVTARYGNDESGMSNEMCGINGTYASDPGQEPDSNPETDLESGTNSESGGSSSGGCFIAELM